MRPIFAIPEKYFDYKIFLLISLVIGLSHFDLNLVDDHAWRQSLTLSISKNLLEYPNPLYPRTVFCCKGEYIIGSEFPFYNMVLALLYKIFGFQHWYGRVVNLIVTTMGVYYFYRNIERLFNSRLASFAAIFLLSSIYMVFARKSMPDTFSISLVLMAVWYFLSYMDKGKTRFLIFAALLLGLGGLSKFPAYCSLAFLVFPFFSEDRPKMVMLKIGVGVFLVSIIVSVWYLFWMPHLVETYGNQLVWPTGVWEGLVQIFNDSERGWFRLEVNAFSNRLPFFIGIMGLGIAAYKKDRQLLYTFLVFTLMYIAFISKAGAVFTDHNYYVVPYLPMLSLLAGYGLYHCIPNRFLAYVLVTIFYYFGVKSNQEYLKPLDYMKDYPRLTEIVNRFTKKEDKVLINLGQFNPVGLYFADRFGWSENNDVLAKTEWMPDFKKYGLKIIIVDKDKYPTPDLPYTKLYEDSKFVIFQP